MYIICLWIRLKVGRGPTEKKKPFTNQVQEPLFGLSLRELQCQSSRLEFIKKENILQLFGFNIAPIEMTLAKTPNPRRGTKQFQCQSLPPGPSNL